ncbi:SGNH/GDSL hydrolase family protein [Sporosarcina sp. OR05]|uniref:SGNH/GDSL hydrolase family protein n=1 Tax=Sporosarcina sp. OR05 TaxID=2969819 RepID=UPI00352A03EB
MNVKKAEKYIILTMLSALLLLSIIAILYNVFFREEDKYASPVYSKEKVTSNTVANNLIAIPKTIYSTEGEDMVIYSRNLLGNENDYEVKIDDLNNDVSSYQDYFVLHNNKSGIANLGVELYSGKEIITSAKTKILTNPTRTTPIKGLVMGDSTIITNGHGYVTDRIIENLGSNINLVGTMGTEHNKYEGRGGWTAEKYRTNAIYSNKQNPFYNPSTEDFDFGYYMNNQGFSDLDFVIINLGINDVFAYNSDVELKNDSAHILENFDKIISSIKEYDENIRIGINLTIPPSDDQNMFAQEYEDKIKQARVKQNNFIWIQSLIEHYEESENVDLIPIHLGIDTINNFENSVHPNIDGYNQIGDQITSYLNSLN